MGSKRQSSEAPGLWPPRPLLCTPYWIRYEIRRIVMITPYWGCNTAYCATKRHSHISHSRVLASREDMQSIV